MRSPCYPTVNASVVFIRVVAFFNLVIIVMNCFIGSKCNVKDVGLQIAVCCILPAAVSTVINPIRSYLATRFPIRCGHRKCIFYGGSSRSLKEILLDFDRDIPSDEELRRLTNQASLFLEDFKDELEKTIATATFQCIFSGSVAERYGVPVCHKRLEVFRALNTGFDVMFCAEADNASFSGQKGNVLVELVPDVDGFTAHAQLRPLKPRFEGDVVNSRGVRRIANIAASGTKITHFPQLPNVWYYRCDVRPKVRICTGGFAIMISVGNVYQVEIVLCIKCCEWPPTSDWPTRKRCWPSQEDVTRIAFHGCHLVAKPAPSDEEQTSWRFSFSVAEVELAKLVPNTARKCFLALKIILKDHLQPVVDLSSYQLKTIFLNTLEKTPTEFWVDENIEECFLLLLKEFHDALVSGRCIHFWFRTINLFDGITPQNAKVIAWKITKIIENPAPFIFDDVCCLTCSSKVDKNRPNINVEVEESGQTATDKAVTDITNRTQQTSQSFGVHDEKPQDIELQISSD